MLTLCSTSIDWSATGTWFTGLATILVAILALNSWKKQIKLQDRYQKVDLLLEAFVACTIAGHHWQWSAGIGNERSSKLFEGEAANQWREALMNYRLAWYKASPIVRDKETCSFTPEKLQSRVISLGEYLLKPETTIQFEVKASDFLNQGLNEITKLRDA